MRRVIGIDPGTKNLAICELSLDTGEIHVRLCELRHPCNGAKWRDRFFAWIVDHADAFERADRIIVERQLREPYKSLELMMWTLYRNKTTVVSANTLGAFFGLPKTRKAKKLAAVERVRVFAPELLNAQLTKYDDIADAVLLAVYGSRT